MSRVKDEAEAVDLRTRRRLSTQREISEAALDLFEAQGFTGTTVDAIAQRAGVSPRTFFRYFESKEHVLLVDEESSARALNRAFLEIQSGSDPVIAIDQGWAAVFDSLDRNYSARHHLLRVLQIAAIEPSLRARMLEHEAQRVHQRAQEFDQAPKVMLTYFDAVIILEFFGRAAHLSLELWAKAPEDTSLADAYRSVKDSLIETARRVPRSRPDADGAK